MNQYVKVNLNEILFKFFDCEYTSFNESVILSGLGNELYKRKFLSLIPKVEQFSLQRPLENKSFLKRNGFKTTNSQVLLRIESEEFLIENENKLLYILKSSKSKSIFHQIVIDEVFDNVSNEIIFALNEHILDDFGIISAIRKETGEFNGFIDVKFSNDMIKITLKFSHLT